MKSHTKHLPKRVLFDNLVRKWRVVVVEESGAILKVKVETEAYEQKRVGFNSLPGFLDNLADYSVPDALVPDKIADSLWISYLKNIASAEEKQGATIEQQPQADIDKYIKGENPWLKDEMGSLKKERDKKIKKLKEDMNNWRILEEYRNKMVDSNMSTDEEIYNAINDRMESMGLR